MVFDTTCGLLSRLSFGHAELHETRAACLCSKLIFTSLKNSIRIHEGHIITALARIWRLRSVSPLEWWYRLALVCVQGIGDDFSVFEVDLG